VEEDIPFIQDELDNVTTTLYLMIEGARYDPAGLAEAREKLRKCYRNMKLSNANNSS
jgi:hypothetical protein